MTLMTVKCTVNVLKSFMVSVTNNQHSSYFKEMQLFKMSPAVFAVTDLCRPVWSSSCTVNMLRYGLRALNDPTVSVIDV